MIVQIIIVYNKILKNLITFRSEDTTLRGVITITFLLLSSFFSMLTIYSSAKFSWKTGGEIETDCLIII